MIIFNIGNRKTETKTSTNKTNSKSMLKLAPFCPHLR